MKKLIVGGAALLLVCAVGLWLMVSADSDDITEAFDLDNAEFHLQEVGMPQEVTSLVDGVYESDETRIEVVEGPIYSDLDGDGQLDAAAILQETGADGWRGVFGWTWDGGQIHPVKWMFAWQHSCVAEQGGGLQLEDLSHATIEYFDDADSSTKYGLSFMRNFENRCENLNLGGGSSTVGGTAFLYEGVPVSLNWHMTDPAEPTLDALSTASTECVFVKNLGATEELRAGMLPVDSDASVLLAPEDGAPEVAGPSDIDSVHVWAPEAPDAELLEIRNGYVPAEISWTDSGIDPTCGWVQWNYVDEGDHGD